MNKRLKRQLHGLMAVVISMSLIVLITTPSQAQSVDVETPPELVPPQPETSEAPRTDSKQQVRSWNTQRDLFGLSSSNLQAAIEAGEKNGSQERFGFPLDDTEFDDLTQRIEFQIVALEALTFAQTSPLYAGAKFDQLDEGRLMISLTERDPELEKKVLELVPSGSRSLVRFDVGPISRQVLEAAMDSLTDASGYTGLMGGLNRFLSRSDAQISTSQIALDGSAIVVGVASARSNDHDSTQPTGEARELASILNSMNLTTKDVPLRFEASVITQEEHCVSREHCHDGVKAGIRFVGYNPGGATLFPRCSTGFTVSVGNDEQILTAGHCGLSSSPWHWIFGEGWVGTEQQTLFAEGGYDALRVQIDDSEVSNHVYFSDFQFYLMTQVFQSANLVPGVFVCLSAFSQPVGNDCGHITSNGEFLDWSTSCGCNVLIHSTSGYTSAGGDSGGAVYHGSSVHAVGLHRGLMGNGDRAVTALSGVLDGLGADLYTG